MILLELKKKSLDAIHFIGIGGIGMSGIATLLFQLGYKVQGSDIAENFNTKRLKEAGIKVYIGHQAENISNISYVVVSSAINKTNPEVEEAIRQKIPIIRRAEMLAELMRSKCAVAISGTHGKTTTTALIASLFESAGLFPTVINGGIINHRSTNAYIGSDDYFIAEADESDGTFLHLPASIAVITNIDPEHMEFYKDFNSLIAAFKSFITNLPFYGFAVACIDHKNVRDLINQISNRKIITYGIESTDANIQAFNIDFGITESRFDVKINHRNLNETLIIEKIYLPMPGKHNILNALAAISIAIELNFDIELIKNGFSHFKGIKQRFNKITEFNGASIYDDYAHHPVEVRATLATAKYIANQQNGKVIAVFQPHRYSRVKYLFNEFMNCFGDANQLYITDVYAPGEQLIEGVSGQELVQQIQSSGCHSNAFFIASFDEIPNIFKDNAMPGDVIVMMGAGNISNWTKLLTNQMNCEFLQKYED